LARQQELLSQLRDEKAYIQREIEKRQKHLVRYAHEAGLEIDEKQVKACVRIQAFWRMKRQRKAYLNDRHREHFEAKLSLQQALAAMERAVVKQKMRVLTQDESAERIQRAMRAKLARMRFKKSLYKLMVVKACIAGTVLRRQGQIRRAFYRMAGKDDPTDPAKLFLRQR